MLRPRREGHRPAAKALLWSILAAAPAAVPPLLAAFVAAPAAAQESAPVSVLDSPLAWQLLQQAEDQARENPGEAARLCQKLLDGYSDRVVPAEKAQGDGGEATRFLGVPERVEHFLRSHPSVLDRYRQLEEAEAERMLSFDAPERVAATRGLTRSGLRANLAIAERDLLGARFARALLRLRRAEGHPDLALEEGRTYWYLRAAAAAFLGDVVEREQAEARLRALGLVDDAPELAAVGRFAALSPREVPSLVSPVTHGELSEEMREAGGDGTREQAWQPVWSEVLDHSPFARLFTTTDDFSRLGFPRQLDRGRYDGAFLVIGPAVMGDVVYLCDGSAVLALDRLSHRRLWERPLDAGRPEQDVTAVSDLSVAAVGEGAVVVLPGHGYINERGTPARVTCLEPADGAVRWEVPLATLPGNEFEDLFPLGAPVIADGTVFCMARKITSRIETVDYLLALSLDTGALRFATYIAGAGGVNMQRLRPASTPVVADGSVYVASSAGAVARIDATDGHIQWLERFLVPVRTPRYESEPWEMGGPALVGDALFVIAPGLDVVHRISRESGKIERTMPLGVGTQWGTPRYLLVDEGGGLVPPRLYAIGGDIVAFDPDRPTNALWSFSEANADAVKDRDGAVNRAGIRGRVQCAGPSLVVPGLADVLFVSRETGRIQERVAVDGPSNPVLVGPQLLLGLNSGAMAMMPAASAERLMRERIAKDPKDPEGGLALLDLGIRSKRLDLALEAATAASKAIEQASAENRGSVALDRAREELVTRLLQVVATKATDADAAAIESAHGLLASVSRTPSQNVRRLLAWGDWLAAGGRWAEAVAAVDSLLGDPLLAAEPVERGDEVNIAASSEAIERLRDWSTAAAAADSLAARSAAAARRLEAIDRTDPAALAAFARGSALADAAVGAAASAARGYIERKEYRAAWAVVQDVLRTIPGDQAHQTQAAALAAAAIDCAEQAGWRRSVRSFADALFADRGDLSIPPNDPARALSAIRKRGMAIPPELGGTPGAVQEVPGRLVRVASGAEDESALDGVLVSDRQRLVLLRPPAAGQGADWKPVWETPLVDRDPLVLDVVGRGVFPGPAGDDGAILLWQATSDREAFAAWIGLRDGTMLTKTPLLGDLLNQSVLLEGGRPVNQQMPNELPFVVSEVRPLVTSSMLILARRNGDIVGFRRENLAAPAWRRDRVIDQVYDFGASDWGIALAGRGDRTSGAPANGAAPDEEPALVVLDPESGQPMGHARLGAENDVSWLRILDTGELLVGSLLNVVAFDALACAGAGASNVVPTLPTRWRMNAMETHRSAGAWRIGGAIIVALNAELSDGIVPVDLATARLLDDRFRAPLRLDNRVPELRSGLRAGDQIVLHFRDRVVAFDLHGAVVGEDAVADDERDYTAILESSDGLVVVSNGVPRQIPMSDGSGLRFEYSYVLYRLSTADGCRLLGPGIRVRTVGQRAERWALTRGYVVVSTNGGSLAVPLPPGSPG